MVFLRKLPSQWKTVASSDKDDEGTSRGGETPRKARQKLLAIGTNGQNRIRSIVKDQNQVAVKRGLNLVELTFLPEEPVPLVKKYRTQSPECMMEKLEYFPAKPQRRRYEQLPQNKKHHRSGDLKRLNIISLFDWQFLERLVV
jgi:hypothetical protein